MKRKLFMIALSIWAVSVSAEDRRSFFRVQCNPSAQINQRLILEGVDIDLPAAGIKLEVVGLDVVLKKDQRAIVLGQARDLTTKMCKSVYAKKFLVEFTLNQDVTMGRNENGGICFPRPLALFNVEWHREVSSQFVVQTPEATFALQGKATERYSTLLRCRGRRWQIERRADE